MQTDVDNLWIAQDKYCKGCLYYGHLSSHAGTRCCDYTYRTGKIRKNPPCRCEVKKISKKPRVFNSTTGLILPKPKNDGEEYQWHRNSGPEAQNGK